MQDIPAYNWIQQTITATRQLIVDQSFCFSHRRDEKAFTRKRHFTFSRTIIFLMQKTVRSIQNHLHDFFESVGHVACGLTPSAWSQARAKLSYTAFDALNEQAVLQVVYRDRTHPQLRLWHGLRLVAIDSSLQRLPQEAALGETFGWVESNNQSGECGRYPQGRLSVLTDVLNRIALQTFFEPWETAERDLAARHIERLEDWDVALLDRGFADYVLWARFIKAGRRFVCRCQANTFAIVNRLFKDNQHAISVVVELVPHRKQLKEVQAAGLPERIVLRFVTVRLSTGELEVLATNLLDEQHYPTECFGQLYHYRWGIETFYNLLKSRLDLGNFTGTSVEAIRQDIYSTVFVSNLESILIAPANQQLEEHSAKLKNQQQVNHAVSFHAIKSQIIALLASQVPVLEVVGKLQDLFLANPTTKRPGRTVVRKKPSGWRSYYHQRNVKKAVF